MPRKFGGKALGVDGTDLHSVVIFRLAGQVFAIPVADVREVVPYCWLEHPPRMPAFLHGVLNLGGDAVPVLRLDRLLGLAAAAAPGLEASLLIMRTESGPLALLADRVEGVRDGNAFQFAPLEDGQSFQGCVGGQLHGPQGSAHLLSWRHILMTEEKARLAQFQADAESRLAQLAEDVP